MTPESELDNATKVAAKLTEAQRAALIRHSTDRAQQWGGRESVGDPDWNAGRVLKSLGLIQWADARSGDTLLTPLGLAVRTALADRGGDR